MALIPLLSILGCHFLGVLPQVWPQAMAAGEVHTASCATSACLNLGPLVDAAMARYLKRVEEDQMQAALEEWELVPGDPDHLESSPVQGGSSSSGYGTSTSTDVTRHGCRLRAAAAAPAPPAPSPPVQPWVVQPFKGLRSWAGAVAGSGGLQDGQTVGQTDAGGGSRTIAGLGPPADAPSSLVGSWLGRARALMSPFAAAASFAYQ
jgi:hypothetical protein